MTYGVGSFPTVFKIACEKEALVADLKTIFGDLSN